MTHSLFFYNFIRNLLNLKKATSLSILFFISGFSALIYQVIWQRALFQTFGVNIESTTVIVSLFMLGLGLGALLGGYLSQKFSNRLLTLFILLEFIIGLYGALSLKIISIVSDFTGAFNLPLITLGAYLCLAIPTLCMGATFPILVSFLNREYDKVGKSVSLLYAINALGSALAGILTVTVILKYTGLQGSVYLASILNFLVCFFSSFLYKKSKYKKETISKTSIIKSPSILTLSFLVGWISLSQEILWFRYLNFSNGSKGNTFGYLIFAFLLGIGLGSYYSNEIVKKKKSLYLYISCLFILSSIVFYLSFPFISHIVGSQPKIFIIDARIMLIAINSFILGGVFPLLCEVGIKGFKSNIGSSLSYVYFCNILGCFLSPLITGFIFLNYFSFEFNVLLISLISFFTGLVLLLKYTDQIDKIFSKNISYVFVSFIICLLFYPIFYKDIFYKVQFHKSSSIKYLNQSRYGVISVSRDNVIYGGGVYDGKFNIDPVKDANGIFRAYMFSFLHSNPKDVLEIGLSSGSWAKVISMHEKMRKLDIIEINPKYLDLIRKYPVQSSILEDQKIKIHIDDARRWLKNNSNKKYDIILANTTYHWRSGVSNLLSIEFLKSLKSRLKQNGVIYYNSTGSLDVFYTASKVFKHIYRIGNFCVATDTYIDFSKKKRMKALLSFKNYEGKEIIFNTKLLQEKKNDYLNYKIETVRFKNEKDRKIITDDNLLTEFKL